MIRAEGASLVRGGREILKPTDLALRDGEFTAIVGPNGAGKTTLMRLIGGELAPSAGRMMFEERAIESWSVHDLALRRAVLPQHSNLAFPFTVHEVVALGLGGGAGRRDERDLVRRALEAVDLADFAGRFFQQLSGGEQQRVHFARVLLQARALEPGERPAWLLLDEPTAGLDLAHQGAILTRARQHSERGAGVVAILHDLNLALAFAGRLIVVDHGAIVADGAPAAILTDALIARVFRVGMRMNVVPEGHVPFVIPQTAPEFRQDARG